LDSLITAAARALAAGDPVGALKRVSLRDDPPALALRGIAMAQLGDLPRAKALVRAAARAFGQREPVARARCVVAEAEIALAARDLGWPAKTLEAARETLEAHGDKANAAHAGYLAVRRLLLVGHLDAAETADHIGPPRTVVVGPPHGVGELAVVDQIDASLFLLAHDLGDGVLQPRLVSGLVELLPEGPLLADLEKLRRPRQAADMRGQNPVSHGFPPGFL